ncbi:MULTISPECIES: nuclear transport factor 2 family protein [Amycolatopsis]|uniref:nuclear transport factor 2 family protein n=1 Tax=Amycolatopsis TaxID=1813 RepID=UPI000B8ADF65|nr:MULTISPECIES: nuclear transport factor 2 family protein [Amycolatopsis]OXM66556.1 hypothetical protein CF166_26265 [Amycolatopsis sp. KNN50.9b]
MTPRVATWVSVLTAVIVLAGGFAGWAAVQAGRWHTPNAALADAPATTEAAEQISAALKAVFSYDYGNLARTERAAAMVLVDEAVAQYQDTFAAAQEQAAAQKLIRTTTVASLGVQDLSGGTARVLAFLEQQTLNTTTGQQTSSSAALSVTARKVDGTWKIAALTPL